ncbi:MAG: alpha/beta hydrolase [Rhodococcus sp. (in: high G+C Gram-positive bacteria)]
MRKTTVVLLPGTGSDAHFVRDAFADAVAASGFDLTAVVPEPGDVVGGYRSALDLAYADVEGPFVVGGISLGAAVATQWVLDNPGLAAGLIVAMPAWTGSGAGSPAAVSAAATAQSLRENGLVATVDAMRASAPGWLSDTLERSWKAQWPQLPVSMDDASAYRAPTVDELTAVDLPVAVVAAEDDPVHPLHVAEEWRNAMPGAELATFDLDVLGVRPGELGRLAMRALLRATDHRAR